MKNTFWRNFLGFLLLYLGLIVLLQKYGLQLLDDQFWAIQFAVIFAISGIVFLVYFIKDTEHWWAVIPGIVLLGISAMITVNLTGIITATEIAVSIFLASMGISFGFVYYQQRQFWWAVIPAGVLLSLSVMMFVGHVSLLFLGMAFTFGVLGLINVGGRKVHWPWIPSVALFCVGLVLYISFPEISIVGGYLWPLVLIGSGTFLMLRYSIW